MKKKYYIFIIILSCVSLMDSYVWAVQFRTHSLSNQWSDDNLEWRIGSNQNFIMNLTGRQPGSTDTVIIDHVGFRMNRTATIQRLEITSSGSLLLDGADLIVTGELVLDGNLDIARRKFTFGTSPIPTTPYNIGIVKGPGGTISVDATGQDPANMGHIEIIVPNTRTVTLPTGLIQGAVNGIGTVGNLTLNGSGGGIVFAGNLTVNGDLNVISSASPTFDGNLTVNADMNLTTDNNVFCNWGLTANNLTLSGSGGLFCNADLTVIGDLTLSSSGALVLRTNITPVRAVVRGQLTLSGTGGLVVRNGGILSLYNNIVKSSTGSISASGASVILGEISGGALTKLTIPVDLFGGNTVSKLTLNRVNGVGISSSFTVEDSVILTNGILDIGMDTLFVSNEIVRTNGQLLMATTGVRLGTLSIGNVGVARANFPLNLFANSGANRDVGSVGNLIVSRSKGLFLSGKLEVHGNLNLSMNDSLIFGSSDTLILNGGLLVGVGNTPYISGGVVRVAGSSVTLSIPNQIKDLPDVILDRPNGVSISGSLVIKKLEFKRGDFNLNNHLLTLVGDSLISYLGTGGFSGTTGPTGGKVLIESAGSIYTMKLSYGFTFNRLEIKRETELESNTNDLIFLDTLRVKGVSFYRGRRLQIGTIRGVGIFARYINLVQGSIVPQLPQDSVAALTALRLGVGGTSGVTFNAGTGDVTAECWLKVSKLPTLTSKFLEVIRQGRVVFSVSIAPVSGGFNLHVSGGTTISGMGGYSTSAMVFNLNESYHFAVTIPSTTNTGGIYVDGVKVREFTNSANAGPWSFGFAGGASGLEIDIDELRLWNALRTEQNIRDEYKKQLIGVETNLHSYYRFDEDFGTAVFRDTLYDYTTNRRNIGGLTNIRWVRSKAKLETFRSDLTGVEMSNNNATKLGTVPGTAGINFFSIQEYRSKGVSPSTLRIAYYKQNNIDASSLLPFGIDSIKASVGFWEISSIKPNEGIKSIIVRIPFSSIQTNSEFERSHLVWLYRYSSSSVWRLVGKNRKLEGQGIRSFLPFDTLGGSVQFALGVRSANVVSVQHGSWEDPSTWSAIDAPFISDSVVIKHQVAILSDADGSSLSVASLALDANKLSIYGDKVLGIDNLIFQKSGLLETNSPMSGLRFNELGNSFGTIFLPVGIKKIGRLEINRSGGIQVGGDLEVANLLLLSGSLHMQDYTLTATSSITRMSGTQSGVFWNSRGKLRLSGGVEISIPSWITEVPRLELGNVKTSIQGGALAINDSLVIKTGSRFDVNSKTLRINGALLTESRSTMVVDNARLYIGSNAVSAGNRFIIPSDFSKLRRLDLDRYSGAVVSSIVVFDTLFLVRGTLDALSNMVATKELFMMQGKLSGTWGSSGFSLKILPNGINDLSLPTGIDSLNKVIIERNGNVSLSKNFIISDTLSILNGTLDLGVRALLLRGAWQSELSNAGVSGSDYTIRLASKSGNFLIPSTLKSVRHLTIEKTAELRGELNVKGLLLLAGGTFFCKGFNLFLDGSFQKSEGTLEMSSGTLVIGSVVGEGGDALEFPSGITSISKLIVQSKSGVLLNGNLVILDSLFVQSSTLNLRSNRLKVNNKIGLKNGLLTGEFGRNGYAVEFGESKFPQRVIYLPDELNLLNKMRIVEGRVNLQGGLSVSDSLVLSGGTLNIGSQTLNLLGVLNLDDLGGRFSQLSDGVLNIMGDSNTPEFMLPTWVQTIQNLTLNRESGITVGNSLTVRNALNLVKGAMKLGSYPLTLLGSIDCSQESILTGTTGRSGYEVFIAGENSGRIVWPSRLNSINRLTVNRKASFISGVQDTVVDLSGDLVVLDEVRLQRGILKRGKYNLLAKDVNVVSGDNGYVYPPIPNNSSLVAFQSLFFKDASPASLITKPATVNPVLTNTVTVESHINIASRSSIAKNLLIFSKHDGISGYEFGVDHQNNLYAKVGDFYKQASVFSLISQRWYHVAMTYDRRYVRFFVEGVLIDSVEAVNKDILSSVAGGKIGGNETGGNASYYLDEVRVWQGVRDPVNLRQSNFKLLKGDEGNLLAYYRMDEGTRADTLYDFSKSKAHAVFDGTKIDRMFSEAKLELHESTPDGLSKLQLVGGTNAQMNFSNNVKGLITISTNVLDSPRDSLQVRYWKKTSQLREPFVVEGLDSIVTSLGYWTIDKPRQTGTIENFKIQVDISTLVDRRGATYNPKDMVWMVRPAPSKLWVPLGREVIGSSVRSSEVIPRFTGYLEFALAVLTSTKGVISIKDGNWESNSTWLNNVKPTLRDSVVIEHNVTLGSKAEVRYLRVQDKVNSILKIQDGQSLTITDDILVSGTTNITNAGIDRTSGKIIIAGTGGVYKFPSEIVELKRLELNRESGLQQQKDLLITDSLILRSGKFFVNGHTLRMGGALSLEMDSQFEARGAGSTLRIIDAVPPREQFVLSPKITRLENLVIDRANGVKLIKDLIVKNNVSITNNNAAFLDRTVGNILSKNDLILNVNPLFIRDTASAIYSLDAGTSYATVGDHSLLKPTNGITIEAWVKKANDVDGIIVSKDGYILEWLAGGKLRFTISTVNIPKFVVETKVADFEFETNKWYHVAATYQIVDRVNRLNIDSLRIFVNGTLVAESSGDGGTMVYLTEPLSVGGSSLGFNKFNGQLDELRIWNTFKSSADIRRSLNTQLAGTEGNLVLYYRFDEATNHNVIYDYTLNKLNANVSFPKRLRSNAFVRDFLPKPRVEDNKAFHLLKTFSFSNLKYGSVDFIFDNSVSGGLRVAYYSGSPAEASRLPDGIDSIKKRSGYWEILPVQNVQPSVNAKVGFPISSLNIEALFREYSELKLLWRSSPYSDWDVLDGVLSAKKDSLYSRKLINLNQYVQLAVGVKKRYISTVKSGNWSDPDIWLGGILPKMGEHVEILHPVTLDRNFQIGDALIESTLDINGKYLIVNGDFAVDASGSVIATHRDGTTKLEFRSNSNKALSEKISTVDSLVINTISEGVKITALGKLTVKRALVIEKGVLDISNQELVLEDSIKVLQSSSLIRQNSTITYSGSKSSVVSPLLAWFYNLRINKSNPGLYVSVTRDIIVSNLLSLESGSIKKDEHVRILNRDFFANPGSQNLPITSGSTVASIRALTFSETGDAARRRGFTIEAWINSAQWQASADAGLIVSKVSGPSGWELTAGNDGILRAIVYTSSGILEVISSDFRMKNNVWYHVALTYSTSGTLRLMINGVIVGEAKSTNVLSSVIFNEQDIYLGGNQDGTKRFVGSIDEFRFWKVAKSQFEIKLNDTMQLNGNEESLLVYYPFDEGTGITVYDNSPNSFHAKFEGTSSVLWSDSKALISTFVYPSPEVKNQSAFVEPERSSVSSTVFGLTDFDKEQDKKVELKMRAIVGSGSGKIKILRMNALPRQIKKLPTALDSIISQKGYWRIYKTQSQPFISEATFSTSILNIKNIDSSRLVWAYRASPAEEWQFIGTKLDENKVLTATKTLSVGSFLELAIAQRPGIKVKFIGASFGTEKATDVSISPEVITTLKEADVEVKIQASTKVSFPERDIFQSDFVKVTKLSDTSLSAAVKPNGIFEGREYFTRAVVRVSGILYDTLPDLFRFSVPVRDARLPKIPFTKEISFSKFDVMPRKGRYIAADDESTYDSLRFFVDGKFLKIENAKIMVSKYPSEAIQSLGSGKRAGSVFWSIYERDSLFFTEGRLLYPIKSLPNVGLDTMGAKIFQRKGASITSWEDITDVSEPVVLFNNEKYIQSKLLTRLYDYTLASIEDKPRVYTVLQPELNYIESQENQADLNVKLGAEIYTGLTQTQVQFHYANELLFSRKNIVGNSDPITSAPEDQVVNYVVPRIKKDTVYFYTTIAVNRQGSPVDNASSADTVWFYTMPYSKIKTDTLYATNLGKEDTIKVDAMSIKIVPTIAKGKDNEEGYPFYIESHISRVVQGTSTIEGAERINPFFWTIVPAGYTRYIGLDKPEIGPTKSMRKSRRIGQFAFENFKISIPTSDFPNGTDFQNLTWMKRDTVGKRWYSLGGKVERNSNNIEEFVSELQPNHFLGEYAMGVRSIGDGIANISNLKVQVVGAGKAVVSWRVDSEKDVLGFDIIRTHKAQQKVVASFNTNDRLKGRGDSDVLSYYSVIDEGLAYGMEKYFYRIRYYDKSGNIYDYKDLIGVVSSASPELDKATEWNISQNYPNPFSLRSVVDYSVRQKQEVKIELFDIVGRRVRTLLNKVVEQGDYSLVIEADGLSSGPQNPHQKTIQSELEHALAMILQHPVELTVAGRTDAGVHANFQVANFFTPKTTLNIFRFMYSLNCLLYPNIKIVTMRETELDFSARFSAKTRTYKYFLAEEPSPFLHEFTGCISPRRYNTSNFDVYQMNLAAKSIIGEKDFTSFSKMKNLNHNAKTNVCSVYDAKGMVRLLVGTIVEVGAGFKSLNDFQNILNQKNIKFSSPSAPASVAENQTHGRGQHGKTWRSNTNDNLLFSFTLSPTTWLTPLFQIDLITLVAGLALHNSLTDFFSHRNLATNIKLKWPNDILINNKKICGILVESVYYGHSLSSIAIGIGLNVNQTMFPTELANHTTSLRLEILNTSNPTPINRNDILQNVLQHFFTLINQLSQAKLSRKEILQDAIIKMQLLNQPVSFMWKDTSFCGTIMEQNRTEQNRTEQNRTEQNRTEQNRTEQNRTEQNRTEQNRTEQNRTEQNRTEQNRGRANLLQLLTLLLFALSFFAGGCPAPTPTYTITFNSNGGSNVPNAVVTSGEKATKPTDPTRTNYTFVGWYKETTFTNLFDFDKEIIIKDDTLYALWLTKSTLRVASVSSSQITLEWTSVTNAAHYNLFDNNGQIGGDIMETRYQHVNLDPSSIHNYTLKACKSGMCYDVATISVETSLQITAKELAKGSTDVRDRYGVFTISASKSLPNYRLAIKKSGVTAPTATEINNSKGAYPVNLSTTPVNVLMALHVDEVLLKNIIAKTDKPSGFYFSVGSGSLSKNDSYYDNTATGTDAWVASSLLKPSTSYTLYGLASGSNTVETLISSFTTNATDEIMGTSTKQSLVDKSISNLTVTSSGTYIVMPAQIKLSSTSLLALSLFNNSHSDVFTIRIGSSENGTDVIPTLFSSRDDSFGNIDMVYPNDISDDLKKNKSLFMLRNLFYLIKIEGGIATYQNRGLFKITVLNPAPDVTYLELINIVKQ
ncbi:hypothetical protein CHS0354_000447 [Potamilus streckersoni]|uniref:BPL/LPL catalytic domain-containing protein n=1 Tax=Potamilus streckersoni TaxID=2493646 RepID=A0AAE0T7J2_9BIVA|nr:hypothetical protein CHS0354_000447 [Potamilus streckersoni]